MKSPNGKHKLYAFILVVILLSLLITIKSEGAEYNVVIVAKQDKVNPNDIFEVSVYIPGSGEIQKAKLIYYGDDAFGIKAEAVHCVQQKLDFDNLVLDTFTIVNPMEDLFNTSKGYCVDRCNYLVHSSDIGTEMPEDPSGNCPPFSFLINVKDSIDIIRGNNDVKIVPSGDYKIRVLFSYLDEEGWHNSTDERIIHINSWYEKNEKLVIIIGLFLAIVGIVVGEKTLSLLRSKLKF
ncbi:hypothetical protein HYT57_05350 [Candidatus Woesearchaeota archaeon]|nr:hypothetical protein [Candidatus Woesearchaeota archaeon]